MFRWSVTRFFQTLKISSFLYENHRGCPTLTLLNVRGVLGVLNVLYALHVLHGRIVDLLGLVFTREFSSYNKTNTCNQMK